jgi:hypothetical protein
MDGSTSIGSCRFNTRDDGSGAGVNALNIVDDGQRSRAPRHRLGHALRWLLGTVLLLASVIAALPTIFVAAATLVFTLAGDPPDLDTLEPGDVAFLAGSAAAAAVLGWLAVRLLRGRRHLVLFLRRFGFTPATQALTAAAVGALGQGWRLVTLDDREIAPVGVNRRSTWAVRLLWLGALVALGAGVWYAANWFSGDQLSSAVSEAIDDANAGSSTADDPVAAIFGAIVAALVVGTVVVLVGLVVLIVPVAVAGTAALFLGLGNRSVRRAERAKAVRIEQPGDVERATSTIRKRVRRVFAPRMAVARVANPLWQDVVRRLARLADATIVDVSEPSPNLLWELHTLGAEGVRWVPVGRRERLSALTVDPATEAIELRRVLGGRAVLAYSTDRLDDFAGALRSSLELAAADASG